MSDIRIANQIFVEHEFQSTLIKEQSELIMIQDTINSILNHKNDLLLKKLDNKDSIIQYQIEDFSETINKEKKKNLITKIALFIVTTIAIIK